MLNSDAFYAAANLTENTFRPNATVDMIPEWTFGLAIHVRRLSSSASWIERGPIVSEVPTSY
jgi:hypothetical protein